MNLFSIYHENIPPFLQEAAAVPPMQRLKGVGMNCGCEYTSFPGFSTWQSYTRFDHSLGAALITWHFTNDPKQALAALLDELKRDVTIITVTHDVEFAAQAADRCGMMFGGELTSTDTPCCFFAENNFYTTAANRMSRGYYHGAVLCEQVTALCRLNEKKAVAP